MDEIEVALDDLVLDRLAAEALVDEDFAAHQLVDARELGRHVRQRREAVARDGEPAEEHREILAPERLRIRELDARRGGDGVALDQEALAVVQRRERNRAKYAIRHEDEGGDVLRLTDPLIGRTSQS